MTSSERWKNLPKEVRGLESLLEEKEMRRKWAELALAHNKHFGAATNFAKAEDYFHAAECFYVVGDQKKASEHYYYFAKEVAACPHLPIIAKYILLGYCATRSGEDDVAENFYKKAERARKSKQDFRGDFDKVPWNINEALAKALNYGNIRDRFPELAEEEEKDAQQT